MVKELSEMSLSELWELFPIKLEPHNDKWAQMYSGTEEELKKLLGGRAVKISHIGSTAIEGIWAKPIVDILLELKTGEDMEEATKLLTQNGWLLMSSEDGRRSFNRGYTKYGFAKEVYHLHLRYEGDRDEVYFREYLAANEAVAKEYEKLKLSLWKKYEHDRDGYTQAKGEFILGVMKEAKGRKG